MSAIPTSTVVSRVIGRRTYQCQPSKGELTIVDCSGDEVRYESDITQYLPSGSPQLTKTGKVAVRQPSVPPKPLKWWKAQCIFRGLSTSGNVADLRSRIHQHGNNGMDPKFQEGFAQMKQDWYSQIWNSLDDSGKASLMPQRFLSETVGPDGSRREQVITVRVGDWAQSITAAAKVMEIACESWKMPDFATGQRVVIVGNDELQVRSRMAEVERESQRTTARLRKERETRKADSHTAFNKKLAAAKMKDKDLDGNWNVQGRWTISYPGIEEQWGKGEEHLTMDIGYTGGRDGLTQVYANFDFLIVTGVMRFVDTDSKNSSKFGLKNSCLPSSSRKAFQYRWRGEETGEGEIQLGSDRVICSLVFDSPHALHGKFECDYLDEQEFQGFKDSSREPQLDPESLWLMRSDSAYEEARVGRWD